MGISTPIRLCVYLLLFWLPLLAKTAYAEELRFGIVPQQSATELAKNWIPVMQEIAARTGISVSFHTAPDISTFEDRLKAGEYDLAYMNPFHYTVFSKTTGYRAFAKEKDRRLIGIIVVPKNSPAKSISDLAGKSVIFPSPAAFAASILPRAEFDRQNVNIKSQYVLSHDSVYKGVAQGLFDAGGGISRTFEALDPQVSDKLRILTTTPSFVPHALAYHPRVSTKTMARITDVMLAFGKDEQSKKLLEPLSIKGFIAADDKDWDEIRRLNIKQPIGRAAK